MDIILWLLGIVAVGVILWGVIQAVFDHGYQRGFNAGWRKKGAVEKYGLDEATDAGPGRRS